MRESAIHSTNVSTYVLWWEGSSNVFA